jgi:hypothetical protein
MNINMKNEVIFQHKPYNRNQKTFVVYDLMQCKNIVKNWEQILTYLFLQPLLAIVVSVERLEVATVDYVRELGLHC